MTPFRILLAPARSRPDHPAIVSDTGSLSFSALLAASCDRAGTLRARGVRSGDRVGLLMANRPEWLAWFFAISAIGGVAALLNPAYADAEIERVLDVATVQALVCDERHAARLASGTRRVTGEVIVEPAPSERATDSRGASTPGTVDRAADAADTPAVIFFSSGSTGRPKGIVHSSRNLARIVDGVRRTWRIGADDVLLVAMPLAFVYASVVESLTALATGATIVLQERFDAPRAVEWLAAGRLTAMMGVPTLYRMLVGAAGTPCRASRLRFAATAGETLPPTLASEFEATFGCPLLDLYGLTEAPHVIAHDPGRDARSRPLSCGRPLEHVETRVLDDAGRVVPRGDVGELALRAPWMFHGYVGDAATTGATFRDGWFLTGDLAREDADGYFYVVDRKKALIKRGGLSVIPAEVENVLRQVPGVGEVAVVGVPDAERGERVKAWVVPAPGAILASRDLIGVCAAHLASYKVPELIEVVDALPKGPTGKIDRTLLRR